MLQWFPLLIPRKIRGQRQKGVAGMSDRVNEWASRQHRARKEQCVSVMCVLNVLTWLVCFLLGYTLTGASHFGSNRSGRVLTVCPERRPISFPPHFNFRKKECNDGHRIGQVDSANAEWCHRALAPCIRKVIWHSADKMYSVFNWSLVWLPVSEKATWRFVLERKIY